MEITLSYPVEVGGNKYETVTMRRPKVKDMVSSTVSGQTDAQNEVNLIARLCGINPEDLLEFDGKDYLWLQKVLSGFLSLA